MRQAGLAVVVALLLASCSDDPNEQANRQFVEVQQLIDKVEQQGPEERLRSLQSVEAKLQGIVAKYPSANLAVQLSSGQSVGKISLKVISGQVGQAEWTLCLLAPMRTCVINEAMRRAQLIEQREIRAEPLAAIARAQAKAGLMKEAATTIALALQIAQSIVDKDQRTRTLVAITVAQAKAGLVKEAAATIALSLQIAQSIEDETSRDFAFQGIADALAEAGMFTEALLAAQSIRADPFGVSFSLARISEEQAKAGLIKEAATTLALGLQIAQSMSDGHRIAALGIIAGAQAKAGMTKEAATTIALALQVARPDGQWKYPLSLQYIAGAQAEAGNFAEALELARSIRVNEIALSRRVDEIPLLRIVSAQARVRKFADALALARSIKDEFTRNQALAAIALGQARAGQFADALALARSIKGDNTFRMVDLPRTIVAVAVAQASVGHDLPDALLLSLSSEIAAIGDTATVLAAIAEAMPN